MIKQENTSKRGASHFSYHLSGAFWVAQWLSDGLATAFEAVVAWWCLLVSAEHRADPELFLVSCRLSRQPAAKLCVGIADGFENLCDICLCWFARSLPDGDTRDVSKLHKLRLETWMNMFALFHVAYAGDWIHVPSCIQGADKVLESKSRCCKHLQTLPLMHHDAPDIRYDQDRFSYLRSFVWLQQNHFLFYMGYIFHRLLQGCVSVAFATSGSPHPAIWRVNLLRREFSKV